MSLSYSSRLTDVPSEWARDRTLRSFRTASVVALWTALSMFLGRPKVEGSSTSGIRLTKEESYF